MCILWKRVCSARLNRIPELLAQLWSREKIRQQHRPQQETGVAALHKAGQDSFSSASTNADVRGCCLAPGCDAADQLLWQDTGSQNLLSPCRHLQSMLPCSVTSVLTACKAKAASRFLQISKNKVCLKHGDKELLNIKEYHTSGWPASFECSILTKNRSYCSKQSLSASAGIGQPSQDKPDDTCSFTFIRPICSRTYFASGDG